MTLQRAEGLPLVRGATFDLDGGVTLEFALPEDVKRNGLVRNQVLYVPGASKDLSVEVDALHQAATELALEALDGFDKLPAVRPGGDAEPERDLDDDD